MNSVYLEDADFQVIKGLVEADVRKGSVKLDRAMGGVEISGPDDLLEAYDNLVQDAKARKRATEKRDSQAYQQPDREQIVDPYAEARAALADIERLVPSELIGGGKTVDFRSSKATENVARAQVRAEGLILSHPDYLPAKLFLGQLQLANENYHAAERTFRALAYDTRYDAFVTEGTPDRWDVYTYALFAAAQTGKAEDVLKECENALKRNPAFKANVKELAGLMASGKRFDVSERLLRKVTDYDPKDPEAHWALVMALQEQGKRTEADNGLRQLLETDSVTYSAVMERLGKQVPRESQASPTGLDSASFSAAAMDAEHNGDMVGAVKYMKAAIKAQPENPDYHVGMGMLLLRQGRMDKAEQAFREALLLNSNLGAAHFGLGRVMQGTGRPQEAIGKLRTALEAEADPKSRKIIYAALAQAYRAAGDSVAAQYYDDLHNRAA